MHDLLTDYKYTLMGDKVCVQQRETNQYVTIFEFPDRAEFDKMLRMRTPEAIERYWRVISSMRILSNLAAVARITGVTRSRAQQIQESFFHHLEKWCYSRDILSRPA